MEKKPFQKPQLFPNLLFLVRIKNPRGKIGLKLENWENFQAGVLIPRCLISMEKWILQRILSGIQILIFFGFTGWALELGFECKNPLFGALLGTETLTTPRRSWWPSWSCTIGSKIGIWVQKPSFWGYFRGRRPRYPTKILMTILISFLHTLKWDFECKKPHLGVIFRGRRAQVTLLPREDPDDHPDPAHWALELGFECKKKSSFWGYFRVRRPS